MISINDEEALKKENLSLETYTKDFNECAKNVNCIKNKIEKEMDGINNSYEKIDKEISMFFESKHEKLHLMTEKILRIYNFNKLF